MKFAANLVSILFHPVLMPLAGIYVMLNSGIYLVEFPGEIKKYIYLIVALFSIVLPLAVLSLLAYWHLVRDMVLSARHERFMPMSLSFVSVFVLHVILSRTIPVKLLTAYTFSMAVVIVVYLLSNISFKTSMHLLGLGGISGLLAMLSAVFHTDLFFLVALVVLVSGIVAAARLYLEAHTIAELVAGFAIGFAGVFCTMYLYIS
ncbi:MAG: hypothetical protein JXB34_02935 [Bacteroidales bacterium]|nr:hypothetical protein [Bacteroidales bacterium]